MKKVHTINIPFCASKADEIKIHICSSILLNHIVITAFFVLRFFVAFGQQLTNEQEKAIANFIDCIKYQKKEKLTHQTFFPISREYPIPQIKNSYELLARYNEVFDDSLTKIIANSKPSKDWSVVGMRGIMLSNGIVWLDYDGRLIAVNYQSKYEEKKKNELIRLDKDNLHKSLKDFEKPVHILETTKYRIRIDDLGKGNYRYASWLLKSKMSDKPDVIIKNGEYKQEGNAGNHVFEFRNEEFTYECALILMGKDSSPSAYLTIYKGQKEILSQKGIIITK